VLDEALAQTLARELRIHPVTARCLVARGLGDATTARAFLEPRFGHLRVPTGPEGIAGFDTALERLLAAVRGGERVGVFGDYDVDGVTSCAIVTHALRGAGIQVSPRVASRHAGYGFGVADATALADAGCTLIVTCDTGTSDLPAIEAARARGIDVIVLDHHQVPERAEHPALALINPHRPDSRYPFKGLCSAGLAFMLARCLESKLRAAGLPACDAQGLLDLVAIGTIADMAPLQAENRVLVQKGLQRLCERRRPGLAALLARAEVPADRVLDEIDVSFRIAPRLNAPGRLGDAGPALELLLCTDHKAAGVLADALDAANVTRRELTEQVTAQALEDAALQADRSAIVVGRRGWHHGVVGIVAAKLVERYARPACVIGFDEHGEGRGSVRAGGPTNVYLALCECADQLVRHGGHAAAAGLTVREEQLDSFGLAFAEACAAQARVGEHVATLEVDAEIPLAQVDERLAQELARLAPFGVGNAPPVVRCTGVAVRESRRVGDGSHLKLTLGHGTGSAAHSAIAFRMGDRDPGAGAMIDVAFQPEMSHFRGTWRVELKIHDLRLVGG
jgi:single-stranded-DNA-specific exonuclease